MFLGNVIWPFHGALLAQWIPVFLLIETFILRGYFRESPGGKIVAGILSANLVSSLLGMVLVSPLQLMAWDSLVTKASDQINACVLAFFLTVPLELLALGGFRCFAPTGRRFRACLMMNLATYGICLAVVIYHWRWGAYAE